ncbi:MAG TPA: hypothetical protein VIG24_19355 [Acidimicrobiia bacterium]
MTTATAALSTLRNGRTEYRVEYADGFAFERGPAFHVYGVRGAHYMLVPAVDYTEETPVWVLMTLKSSAPFDFATIIDGEWVVLR